MSSIPAEIRQFRNNYQKIEVSKRYSGIGHLIFTSTVCLGGIAACIYFLSAPTWLELLTVPVTFLYANLAEYFGHKGPMHHKKKYFGLIFKRHTLQHHNYFTEEAMECETTRDFKMILFPPILIVFFFGLFAIPVGILLYATVTHNVGFLFVATGLGYFLNYEWLHLMYHQPEDSWIFKLPFTRGLRAHHMKHHDRKVMSTCNFNITYPICDVIFRTRMSND